MEETKKSIRICLDGNLRKKEDGEGEKYWLIKNSEIKGTITSKREDNQTSTFYIMIDK